MDRSPTKKQPNAIKKKVTIAQAVNKALNPNRKRKIVSPAECNDEEIRQFETFASDKNTSNNQSSSSNNNQDNVTTVVTKLELPRLCNVEYPGVVENPASAIRTLGGPIRVSEVFSHSARKLELKHRPGDIFCNPVFGTGRTTCGLLIRIRRKKEKKPELDPSNLNDQNNLIDLDEQDELPYNEDVLSNLIKGQTNDNVTEILPDINLKQDVDVDVNRNSTNQNDDDSVESSSTTPTLKKLIEEEDKILDKVHSQFEESDNCTMVEKFIKVKEIGSIKRTINLPKGEFRVPDSKMKVQALGVINRCYTFNGVSDFQYLPMIQDENQGEYKSIVNDIFPGFGEHGEVYSAVKMESGEIPSFPFCLPMNMSKFDKPMQNLFKSHPLVQNPQEASSELLNPVIETDEAEVNSTRTRRSVYTHTVSFRWFEENNEIKPPQGPYPQALEDAASKLLTGSKLDAVKELFEHRPIWTKIGLEWETKFTAEQLKYILPCVAYFTLNGPWRSLWIKFGYDPRKDKGAFIYQLIDYRLPFQYRTYQVIDQADEESYHKFKPDRIPPKAQMFFQFCDLQIPEIQELAGALSVRLHDPDQMTYNPKYGFLDEDIMEFCRYCMSRCVEVRLHSLGKIKTITVPQISLETGGVIPVDQLRVKPRKQPKKRIRTTASSTRSRKVAATSENQSVTSSGNTNDEPEVIGRAAERDNVLHNLQDYFDDDEEEEGAESLEDDEDEDEEVDDSPSQDQQDPLGNCFDDDEEEEEVHDQE